MLQDRQARRHAFADRGDDLYQTPPIAIEKLLEVEWLPHCLWEPACGPGAIVNALRAAGHEVIGSDVNDFGNSIFNNFWQRDFLKQDLIHPAVEAIITNPPFRLAEQFVAHALDICPRVIMLLRLAFLESERRTPILENAGLAHVYVFKKRLPMMHRADWTGPRATSAVAYAWYVWDREHRGPTTISRI